MHQDDFFKQLKTQFAQQLPFVGFAQNFKLKAYLQSNNSLNTLEDFSEPGFVFCPFSDKNPKVIFPETQSKILTAQLKKHDVKPSITSFTPSEKEKQSHLNLVSKAIETIKMTEIKKVVCSRKIKIKKEIDALETFKKLAFTYPNAYSYCWYHPQVGLWLGATPEQLLYLDRNTFETVALAGTKNAIEQPEPQWAEKEKEEQKMVVDFIISVLKKHSQDIVVGDIQNVRAGDLWHLKSKIKAKIQPDKLLEIIQDLHPTSAVCGLPKDKAKAFIEGHEKYQRSYYSGFLGALHFKESTSRSKTQKNQELQAIQSIKRISDLYVNLRCMQVFDNHIELYVGGGITKDSSPEAEYAEILAKSQTLLNVL